MDSNDQAHDTSQGSPVIDTTTQAAVAPDPRPGPHERALEADEHRDSADAIDQSLASAWDKINSPAAHEREALQHPPLLERSNETPDERLERSWEHVQRLGDKSARAQAAQEYRASAALRAQSTPRESSTSRC